MRVAILADIHANLPAFEAVLADADAHGCERIYHAGDLIAIGPYPAEVVDLARARGVRCVKGNHEEWVGRGLPAEPVPSMDAEELAHQHWTHAQLGAARREYIEGMPTSIRESLEGVRLTVVHFALAEGEMLFKRVDARGSDEAILSVFGEHEADLVCFGHIHPRRLSRQFGGRHFLNPGTVGCNPGGRADYAVVECTDGAFAVDERSVEYDSRELLVRYDELQVPARDFLRRVFLGVR